MRTHTYSIAIAHLETGDWTVAIVQTSLSKGRIVDQRIVYGPIWHREHDLSRVAASAVARLQQLVHQDEAERPRQDV
jgi:hypothetical protein